MGREKKPALLFHTGEKTVRANIFSGLSGFLLWVVFRAFFAIIRGETTGPILRGPWLMA
jgi:hypothetical protein